MTRLLAALTALATLAPALPQQTPLEARFLGNMAFAVTDGTVTLMSDFPYQSGYSGYMTYDARAIASATPETLALITHRHRDHWDPSLFGATNWKVAGPADVTAGIESSRVVPMAPPARFGAMTIEALETPHASVGHYSYIVTWHGRRMYFTGDTEDTTALLAARDLDVAFVSPWLLNAVTRAGARIDAKRVVVYHHEHGQQVPQCGDGCVVPEQGEVLRF